MIEFPDATGIFISGLATGDALQAGIRCARHRDLFGDSSRHEAA
jgi:hypothetical protein